MAIDFNASPDKGEELPDPNKPLAEDDIYDPLQQVMGADEVNGADPLPSLFLEPAG